MRLAVLLCLMLSGCGLTPQGDAIRAYIQQQGKKVAAEGLENTEWALCRVFPVGAVRDRYGVSKELADAYNTLCDRWGGRFIIQENPEPEADHAEPQTPIS